MIVVSFEDSIYVSPSGVKALPNCGARLFVSKKTLRPPYSPQDTNNWGYWSSANANWPTKKKRYTALKIKVCNRILKRPKKSKSTRLFLTQGTPKTGNFVKIMTQILRKIISKLTASLTCLFLILLILSFVRIFFFFDNSPVFDHRLLDSTN